MRLPESTQVEIFRRMVFNYLANNTDDHNKNFSFLMNENGRWRLSPAYYKPTLPQELQTNAGDASFDHIYEMFKALPTGEDIKKEILICFAGATSPVDAWLTNSSVILKDLNSVDEKILFDININKIENGTVTFNEETGAPTFTAA